MDTAETRGVFPIQPLKSRLVDPFTLEYLIRKHTVWPFFWALGLPLRWRAERQKKLQWNILLAANDYLVYRWPRIDTLQLCPTCVVEDYDAFGEPYWHTSHQLDVSVCHKHGDVLIKGCQTCGKFLQATGFLLPALKCSCGEKFKSKKGDEKAHGLHMARTAHALLTANIEAPLKKERAQTAIRVALRAQGFMPRRITPGGSREILDTEALENAISQKWNVPGPRPPLRLHGLTYGPSSEAMVIAIGYLFPSVNAYVRAVQPNEGRRKQQQLAG